MASTTIARKTSPFKDPRTPPCTPRDTAKIWDEYERRALENARRRGTSHINDYPLPTPSPRNSNGTVTDIIRSYGPPPSPVLPTTLSTCKTCQEPIPPTPGFCKQCKKTILLPSPPTETTPPPITPTHAYTCTLSPTPPHPTRLTSLCPPPPLDTPTNPSRSRKSSLTDPNEPFLRLQISRRPLPSTPATPTTPSPKSKSTSTPTSLPPSSRPNTRPSSLANITALPARYPRHHSATPSELSTLYPYVSNPATSPPSVCRASYGLQNTMSAWDDWDSGEEGEKAGLVGYWRGRRWRGSRGSLGGSEKGEGLGGSASGSVSASASAKEREGKEGSSRRERFVRAISCGCHDG